MKQFRNEMFLLSIACWLSFSLIVSCIDFNHNKIDKDNRRIDRIDSLAKCIAPKENSISRRKVQTRSSSEENRKRKNFKLLKTKSKSIKEIRSRENSCRSQRFRIRNRPSLGMPFSLSTSYCKNPMETISSSINESQSSTIIKSSGSGYYAILMKQMKVKSVSQYGI